MTHLAVLPHPTLLHAALADELHRIGTAHNLCVAMGEGMQVVRNTDGRLIMVHPSADVPYGTVRTQTLAEWMGWA
jgi:hypothetical protein